MVLKLLLFLFCLSLPATGGSSHSPRNVVSSSWRLIWSDEFNGPSGPAIDSTKWTAEVGGGSWGNNELEYYTARRDNAYQSGGSLVIKAIKEKYRGADNVFLLNLAVGGNWPESPDSTTVFPQTMLVDYIRVYQRVNQ